jgi:hypothetical protein
MIIWRTLKEFSLTILYVSAGFLHEITQNRLRSMDMRRNAALISRQKVAQLDQMDPQPYFPAAAPT